MGNTNTMQLNRALVNCYQNWYAEHSSRKYIDPWKVNEEFEEFLEKEWGIALLNNWNHHEVLDVEKASLFKMKYS